jgi:hypothetical protein
VRTLVVRGREWARRFAPQVETAIRAREGLRRRVARLEQDTAELREEVEELRRLSPRVATLVDLLAEELGRDPTRHPPPGSHASG